MSRRQYGYWLTNIAVIATLVTYILLLLQTAPFTWGRVIVGTCVTVLPLLIFLPETLRHHNRAFAVLALLAPLYLFYGGIIFLWGATGYGLWLCGCSILLEIGAILHNYQRRKKHR